MTASTRRTSHPAVTRRRWSRVLDCSCLRSTTSNFPSSSHATSVVEGVGLFLFALYHVAIIIVLTNMLIAMMSHSFEAIQASTASSEFEFDVDELVR